MSLVEVDRTAWHADGDRRPFALRHGFANDPRLTHDQVSAVAGRLPVSSIEMNRADLELLHHGEGAEALDRPAADVARDIVSLRRWMAIKNIEQLPDYRRLVDEGLDGADAGLGLGSAMLAREGYIFLSAASSVVPAHVDHEHNLLLQVRGTKTVTVGSFPDGEREQEVMEGMHSGSYGRTGFPPHDPRTFTLEPGTGVYIPPRAVHVVENHDDLSISLSLVFHTRGLERAARVYAVNGKLRRLGLHPRPPGRSLGVDRAKSGAALAWRAARRRT
jgi:hypothetical protein